jgi:predicted DNA-binding protein (UPF0251 family)
MMAAPINAARGTELPHAKLTPEKVASIRMRASMGVSQRKMAKEYGVHYNTINRAVLYENWWHTK